MIQIKHDITKVMEELSKLKDDFEKIEQIKDVETAIKEFDKNDAIYKKIKDTYEQTISKSNLDNNIKDEIKNRLYEVWIKSTLLDDEFDCRGWTIFRTPLTLSFEKRKESIRKALSTDAEILAKWWNDKKIMASTCFPNELGKSVNQIKNEIENRPFYNLLFIIQYERKPIGEMSANIKDKIAECGIKICEEEYQDKGIGTFVLQKFFDELFKSEDVVDKISITINANNDRAMHVYQDKLHLTKTGEFDFEDANFNKQKAIKLEITKNEWKEKRGK